MKHLSYPKIEQFRNVIRDICYKANSNGHNPPVVTFKGTVKLHGTNAAICYNDHDGLWTQSRNKIITTDNDNAGFASFVEKRNRDFLALIDSVSRYHGLDTESNTLSIHGEWAGNGIQKGVGISELDKSFYIFGIKISPIGREDDLYSWLSSDNFSNEEVGIFNVGDFRTFTIDIDFSNPKLSQNKLIELTTEIGNQCPVAKQRGAIGIGEGIVWSGKYLGFNYRFKVKDARHSISKVKKLASVDVEKINSINEFVEYSVTKARFDQACIDIFGIDGNLDVKRLGDVLRWVVNDITEEEIDVLLENNLTSKDVNKFISKKTREMFFSLIN